MWTDDLQEESEDIWAMPFRILLLAACALVEVVISVAYGTIYNRMAPIGPGWLLYYRAPSAALACVGLGVPSFILISLFRACFCTVLFGKEIDVLSEVAHVAAIALLGAHLRSRQEKQEKFFFFSLAAMHAILRLPSFAALLVTRWLEALQRIPFIPWSQKKHLAKQTMHQISWRSIEHKDQSLFAHDSIATYSPLREAMLNNFFLPWLFFQEIYTFLLLFRIEKFFALAAFSLPLPFFHALLGSFLASYSGFFSSWPWVHETVRTLCSSCLLVLCIRGSIIFLQIRSRFLALLFGGHIVQRLALWFFWPAFARYILQNIGFLIICALLGLLDLLRLDSDSDTVY